ncbi:hypothetical protein GQ53DRAFT_782113 [Thozetella sp. PMI_491]|nr:hypothetical protein GQ53DRAFT_782113 [Thozetella sp. PMI_491]
MAPVPVEAEISYPSLIAIASHFTAAAYATITICTGLRRSYRELGPSQDTRLRILWRSKLSPAFGSLAILSLLLTCYSSLRYATISYQTWADERGFDIPSSHRPQGNGENGSRPHIARWLSDTPVYLDAYEIISEKARRFWWGQQLDLALIAWALMLAIEGRRRKIPFLWAYIVLAQSISLTFAQNLFYLALLLTPSPIGRESSPPQTGLSRLLDRAIPPKPDNWTPHPALYAFLLLVNYAAIFRLPYAAGTPLFIWTVLASKVLPLAFVAGPCIVPQSWGSILTHPHSAYDGYTALFQFVSLASALLFAKSTATALLYNLPDSHKHRHSIRIPFDTEERSRWERTTGALGKVLGSTSDHPIVAAVGRDVLFSGLSLGFWAAVRAIDVDRMLRSSILFYDIATAASSEETSNSPIEIDTKPKDEPVEPEHVGTIRGRAQRSKLASQRGEKGGSATTPAKRRGRPRKIKADPEEEEREEPGDKPYEPNPEEKAEAVEGDILPGDDGLDWESSSLAWGLSVLGGLGAGSAAVFGAECIAR